MVPVEKFTDDEFLLFCTRNGTVKKTALSEYSNVRVTGVKAIKIEDGDELIDVQVTSGTNDIVHRDAPRPVGPVPRAGRAPDGSRHDRREGHRARRRTTR